MVYTKIIMKKKLVLILGAGATYSDVANKSKYIAPPLDKHFFSICKIHYSRYTDQIQQYMQKYYHRNIYDQKYDSLEGVMATIYTDLFDIRLKNYSSDIFVELIKLFNKRLSSSTNSIKINHQRHLYRLLVKYFEHGYQPENITFITFNQDIQIERVLDILQQKERWKNLEMFSFPRCYGLDMAGLETTNPPGKLERFDQPDDLPAKIKIFKLHGSLNWLSPSSTDKYSLEQFFQTDRKLRITTRKKINPELRYNDTKNPYSLPIILPPVNNKSAIMHNQLKIIWEKAEQKLKNANEIVFWGYSLPDLDFESKNLFQRNLIGNSNISDISLIDPNSHVSSKYIESLDLDNVKYYKNVISFINNHFV